MEMFEVQVFSHDNKMLRRSLVQASHKTAASREALNVFKNTPGAYRFTID